MTPRWSEVTAVMGGTFDPPHLGHREAVRGLFENPGVRRVLIIPSAIPPLKPGATSGEDRFRLAQLNFQGLPDVTLDRRELERAKTNSQPSYTIDTIRELKREHPQLAFVIGTDQLVQLQSWHRFRDLLDACYWIVLARKPEGEAVAMKTLMEWQMSGLPTDRFHVVDTPAQAVSSTEIRHEIARSTDPKTLLKWLQNKMSPDVIRDLMEHRIYGMRPHEHER